ncbi:unnamed protein product [Allacma fusca]|uniref:Uncharacterized protein n=1 Tax=Allacma fusca TaxID=39272 RepID=A0A8J2PAV0_9HEXA|nr:unnamed protein product [Allacma fusca]
MTHGSFTARVNYKKFTDFFNLNFKYPHLDFGSGSRDFSNFQNPGYNDVDQYSESEERKCPPEWELYNKTVHTRGAGLNCQAYGNGSTPLNLNSLNEHR